MRLPHRCTRCERRVTFSRLWSTFIRRKRCWFCGGEKFFVDRWMLRRGREQKCICDGYHFPHRKGSRMCFENPMLPEIEEKLRTGWANRYEGIA